MYRIMYSSSFCHTPKSVMNKMKRSARCGREQVRIRGCFSLNNDSTAEDRSEVEARWLISGRGGLLFVLSFSVLCLMTGECGDYFR